MSLHRRCVLIVFSVAAAGFVLAGCAGSASSTGATLTPAPVNHRYPAGRNASAGSSQDSAGTSGRISRAVTTSGQVGETVAPAAPLVIRSGTVTLKVARAHVVDAFNGVSRAAASLGGFVASSSGNGPADAGGASIVVRVPSSQFETLVGTVDRLGKVEAQSENGQDVTAESVNLSARVANLKAEETSLRALLSRAGSIAAILQVQDQLFGVEGDIEQLSAQEGSLIDQATFATLTVSLTPKVGSVTHRKRAGENPVVRAVKLAAHNTALAARAVVLAVGWAFPFLVLALVILGAWWARRRVTRRRDPLPSTPGVS